MLVYIKTNSGREGELILEGNETVLQLKEKIEEIENIPPQQQRLIFYGKILVNDQAKLSEYNIANESVIHMAIALRGG